MIPGLDGTKFLIILVIAVIIVGPERLPRYAEALARLIKRGREYLEGAKDRVQDDLGEDFSDVDWKRLDPRQYDPRRIIREALLDETPTVTPTTSTVARSRPVQQTLEAGAVPPFDTEAT